MLQKLIPWLIERVGTADKHVVRVVPTEPARPFFASAEHETAGQDCAGMAAPDGNDGAPVPFTLKGETALRMILRAAA